MKKDNWTKHICLYFLIYLFALQNLTSRWIVDWLHIPATVCTAITALLYLPFLVFAVWMFLSDVKKRRFDLFKILYYGFALYYCGLFAYRFFMGMEIKDNLYYTAICLGSFALFSLIIDGEVKTDKNTLEDDVCGFALLLIIYWIGFYFFIKPHIIYSPINEIAIGGCISLLFPVCEKKIWDLRGDAQRSAAFILLAGGLLVVAMMLGSRAIFAVIAVETILILLICAANRRAIIKCVMSILLAVVVVAGMFILGVGNVRYAVYRETGITINMGWFPNQPSTDPTDDSGISSPTLPSVQMTPDQINAQSQINRSDAMRKDLLAMSMARVKENVLFGTGEVLYKYEVSGEVFKAPAHNFILATMNCYGLIGLIMLLGLVVTMLIKIGAFQFKQKSTRHLNMLLFLTLIVYFGVGLVQATVYDMMVMPTMLVVLSAYASALMHKGE